MVRYFNYILQKCILYLFHYLRTSSTLISANCLDGTLATRTYVASVFKFDGTSATRTYVASAFTCIFPPLLTLHVEYVCISPHNVLYSDA